MNFFRYFPKTNYRFGDELNLDVFENITLYSSVLDEVKNNVSFYASYYIQEFERPDQLSLRIYGTTDYHWTFFLINNNIRERGWPINNRDLMEKAQKMYPLTTLTTRTTLTDRFKVGQTITGNNSGASAVINHRHLDLGQLVVENVNGTFISGETLSSVNSFNNIETIVLDSFSPEYLAARFYENTSGEIVDIDPTVGPNEFLVEVTYLDFLSRQNDELKQIRVIKPSTINQVVNSFREAIQS